MTSPTRPTGYIATLIAGALMVITGGCGATGTSQSPLPSQSTSPTQVTSSPSATQPTSPTPTPTPTPPPVQGVVPCPVSTPLGQHTLGSPAPASAGEHADPSLDFCGRGNATIPTGTTRFMTNNNWGLGIADSCPSGSAGEGGMNVVLTVSELLLSGGAGPDTTTEPGDWVDSGGAAMATGGNYQLQVTTVSPDCVWRIAVYTT